MTARYEGIAIVNTGGESCSACDAPAVGRSIYGHLLCRKHAGWAAWIAEELEAEKQASEQRTAAKRAADLTRVRRLVLADEAVPGDRKRAANGRRLGAEARRGQR